MNEAERKSLNGGTGNAKLSDHARQVLSSLPKGCHEINPGVVDKLTRHGLAEVRMLADTLKGYARFRNWLHITEAGRKELAP